MTSASCHPRTRVAGSEDIGRYLSGGKLDNDRPIVGALVVPPDHDNELSVDRLLADGCSLAEGLVRMREHATIKYRSTGRIVRWNVGDVVSITLDSRDVQTLRVEVDPLPDNPFHAVMVPVSDDPAEADLLLDLLRPLIKAVHKACDG